jgi:hypothetical protein
MNASRNTRRNTTVLTIFALSALLLAAPWSRITGRSWAQDVEESGGGDPLAGTWIGSFELDGPYSTRLVLPESFTPMDPEGNRLRYVARAVNPDHTFVGLFPKAAHFSDYVGTYVRAGTNVYDFTTIGYGTADPEAGKFRGEIQFIEVLSGTAELLDDNTLVQDTVLSLFSTIDNPDFAFPWAPNTPVPLHDQDADEDGFPDEGEQPIFCVPWPHMSQRLQLMPPCQP